MTAREALLALPGADHAARTSIPFRTCLDLLATVPPPNDPEGNLRGLAALVFMLCNAMDTQSRLTTELLKRQSRPMLVCTDPSRCPKGDCTQ